MKSFRFFYPGLGIKRWVGLGAVGVSLLALGLAYLLSYFLSQPFPGILFPLAEGTLLVLVGGSLFSLAVWRFYGVVVPFLADHPKAGDLPGLIYQRRLLERGPRIVAIGGGTGLSTLLRGLKLHTSHLTAVLTVADDGGSSGRLRRELGITPPGDFRNCLVALADAEPLMTDLFQFRFGEGSALAGHSFGNLFIVAMSEITGRFEKAIHESSKVLAVRGSILPSALGNVTLKAEMEEGETVHGESSITQHRGRIRQLSIEPEGAEAYYEAVQAIQSADLIVIGPGSLYTSILPNLLVRGIREAVKETKAVKVYVCNVSTQPGETDGYTLADHVNAIYRHVGQGVFHYVLANSDAAVVLPDEWGNKVVQLDSEKVVGAQVVLDDIVNKEYRLRHDPDRLSQALLNIYSHHVRQGNHRSKNSGRWMAEHVVAEAERVGKR